MAYARGPSLLGVVPPPDLFSWSTTVGDPAAGLRPPSSYCPWECFSFFWLPLNPIFSLQLASFGLAELPLPWATTAGTNPVAICIPLFPPGHRGCWLP